MKQDPDSGFKPVLLGLAALVVVSLLVGGVVGAAALGVADLTGIVGGDSETASAQRTRPIIPVESDTPAAEQSGTPRAGAPAGDGSGRQSASAGKDDRKHDGQKKDDKNKKKDRRHKKRHPHRARLTLSAHPHRVDSFGRIYLTGRYRGGNGATLQVQRFEDGRWSDFPVDTTVSGGRFSTYVQSGYPGRNRFRMVDPATGRASDAVSVVVG